MKRLVTIFALLTLLLPAGGLVAGQAAAVNITPVCDSGNGTGTDASGTDVCQAVHQQGDQPTDPIITIIKGGINILAIVIGGAAIIGILASSIRMITAGDASSAATARSGLIYSLVGVAIAVLAEALVAFVLNNVS